MKFKDYECKLPGASFKHFSSAAISVIDHTFISFIANVMKILEPSSYNEAKNHSGWVAAMNKEIEALEANDTWSITDLPKGKKAIGSKWVYRAKLDADGNLERLKGRVVAIGKDFKDTFSPVAKLATVRIVIALATVKGWPLCQVDINNAFLHGYIDEELYMKPPAGYTKCKAGQVCKLKRSLYGLKQASRQWNKELCKLLVSLGFKQSTQDYSLFTREINSEFIVILIYVDDMVLTGTNQQQIDDVKAALDRAFTIKDLGSLKYFLGIEVMRTSSVSISEKVYQRYCKISWSRRY